MDATRSWSELATLLTDNPAVAAAAARAVADPVGYVRDHEVALKTRGIHDADRLTPAIALVDALMDTGELAYLDWKADPDDVVGLLADLPRVRDAGVDVDPAGELRGGVEAVVVEVNRLLAPVGVVVIVVDEGSDAYPLVAVPLDRLPRILESAATVRLPEAPESDVSDPAAPSANLRDPRASEAQYLRRRENVERDLAQSRRDVRFYLDDAPPNDLAGRAANEALKHAAGKLSVNYALGAPFEDLVPIVREAGLVWQSVGESLDAFTADPMQAHQWLQLRVQVNTAIAAVDLLSWAVVLREREVAEQVLSSPSITETKDPMIAQLAAMAGVDASGLTPEPGTRVSRPQLWQRWMDVVRADTGRARVTAFKKHARGWQAARRKDGRLNRPDEKFYTGQFAFELAPLAIHFGLDDAAVRDFPDYPTDLVDHGRSLS